MVRKLLTSVAVATIALSQVVPAYASGNGCQPIYGGGVTCNGTNLVINKTVQNPQTGQYVDNLGINDPQFSASQTINFQVTVSNNGSSDVTNISMTDTMPSLVNYSKTSDGSYDSSNKTITLKVGTLHPNDSKTITITGTIVPADKLPADKSTVCGIVDGQNLAINQAVATADNQPEVQDNAQFCISKATAQPTSAPQPTAMPVYPAPSNQKSTPSTGPEALSLLGLIPTGLAGMFLRKKSSK